MSIEVAIACSTPTTTRTLILSPRLLRQKSVYVIVFTSPPGNMPNSPINLAGPRLRGQGSFAKLRGFTLARLRGVSFSDAIAAGNGS